jgi:hypothetical protein
LLASEVIGLAEQIKWIEKKMKHTMERNFARLLAVMKADIEQKLPTWEPK